MNISISDGYAMLYDFTVELEAYGYAQFVFVNEH